MRDAGRLLILIGAIAIIAGLLFTFAGRFGVPRLPGDFVLRRGTVTVYVPLMTSILVSVVLSLLLYFFRR
ncbi:MAG TPA: DUF2905 family protein [Thermoanaerobaculia bacterium]|nr:DUF2905 family protein [Thermoanaerobaculia bacterium]